MVLLRNFTRSFLCSVQELLDRAKVHVGEVLSSLPRPITVLPPSQGKYYSVLLSVSVVFSCPHRLSRVIFTLGRVQILRQNVFCPMYPGFGAIMFRSEQELVQPRMAWRQYQIYRRL